MLGFIRKQDIGVQAETNSEFMCSFDKDTS